MTLLTQKSRNSPSSSYNKAITPMEKQKKHLTTKEIGAHLLDENLELGIDKVKIVVSVQEVVCSPDTWDYSIKKKVSNQDEQTFRTICPSYRFGELSIGCKQSPYRSIGWVEFNPSKIIHRDGSLANLGDCWEAIDIALKTVSDFYRFDTDPKQITFHRLDLTVDFDPVADMLGLLDLAKRAKPFLRQRASTYFDARSIENQTVMFTTKTRGSTVFYNKSKEQKVVGEHMRIEVQVGRDELLEKGPKDLGGLSMEALRPLFKNRIDNFAHLCYARSTGQIDQIMTSKIETAHLIDIAGIEYLKNFGVSPQTSNHFIKKDRRFRKIYKFQKPEDLLLGG